MPLSLLVAAAKTVVAVRAHGAIRIDGVLDDATWRAASWVDDFAQKEPDEGAPATQRTEVAVALDGEALYVAARMAVADPAALDAPMTRRDDTTGAERFIVSLDPYRSRRTAYSFAVTAAGVRADWIHTDDDEYHRDASWNPVWQAEVTRDASSWTAELRIPLSQLRYPDAADAWGIDFNRYVPRTGEDDFWVAVPRDVTAWASYFGDLRGLDGIARHLRLELLPYLAGSFAVRSPALLDPADPFARHFRPGDGVGLDVKAGLGPLTLDATVNPDFGQVEADPAVVQLDAFEVTFPERRPFFLEGAPIFASNPRAYFYSRRIGAPPPIAPDADFVDAPAAARILAAAKLTGRAGPRWNVGALAAVTAPARARVADAGGPVREELVAPTAGWGVARVERELPGGGVAGAIVTGVARDTTDPGIAAALPRGALAGGVDLRLRPDSGRYELFASAGSSVVTGARAAIAALEEASAHYFQRPDAREVALDPDATTLAGWDVDLAASRRAGDWRFSTYLDAESPGLDLNDLGILRSADDLDVGGTIEHVHSTPTRRLHGWRASVSDGESWNFGGVHKPATTQVAGSVVLPSFVGLSLAAALTRPGLSDDETRGGPLAGVGWGGRLAASASSSHAGRLDWSGRVTLDVSQTEATGLEAGVGLLVRARDRLRFDVAPRVRAATAWSQYVDAIAGTAGGADTFGTRYVFATLELREAALQLRGQLAISPDLVIDAYVEPFVSSGRYVGYGELPRPRARALRRYAHTARGGGVVTIDDGGDVFAVDDPDFTVLSLRSTVVLRWEPRPGSTLYVVWQESRADDRAGARGLGAGVAGDVLAIPGDTVLAVKLSWWWSP